MRSVVVASIVALLAFNFQPLLANSKIDWWEKGSFYQIVPKSFKDSDGDGVGDFKGITSALEYLKEIGVTAAWLSPIFESPMKDLGYDISNHTRINPIFGTLSDFDEMVAKAKKLGIKILLTVIPNHSSDQCEWFKKSVKREKGFEDFYIWDDGKFDSSNTSQRLPPSNWITPFDDSMWTWHPERQQFYLHQFLPHQPDLNNSNPLVRRHMLNTLKYWLDRGVDGFLVDTVPHLFEKRLDNGSYPDESILSSSSNPEDYKDYFNYNHTYTKGLPESAEMMYEWRAYLEEYKKEHGGDTRVLIGEVFSSFEFLSTVYGNDTHHGIQLSVYEKLLHTDEYCNAEHMSHVAYNVVKAVRKNHHTSNWIFANHETSRIATRIGRHKADLYNIIAHCMPGASFTYYGDEIGMSDIRTNCTKVSCDRRYPQISPMQWNSKQHAGFTQGNSTWLPVADDFEIYNVEKERHAARSPLNVYKDLQKLKQTRAFRSFGTKKRVSAKALNDNVFQIIRALPGQEEYMVLANIGDEVEYVEKLSNKTYEFEIVTSLSKHSKGEKINLSGGLYLMPFEAFVLSWSK